MDRVERGAAKKPVLETRNLGIDFGAVSYTHLQ